VCYYEPNQKFWVSKHIKKQIRSTTLCLDWHPSNALLAAGGTDFKCRLFGAFMSDVDGPMPQEIPWAAKITPADCLHEFAAHNHGWVHACAFNADGTKLVYVAHDSTVYAVDANRNPLEYLIFSSIKFFY
jgi:actin related protein 2/3 complex subunit 1A/1B